MKINLYAIYDKKAETFNQIMMFPNNASAIRAVQDSTRGDKNILADHAEDFALYHIGIYDQKTGDIYAETEHKTVKIIEVADLVVKPTETKK